MPRLAVLTPFAAPSVRGNAVTVGRVVHGLRERGIAVTVWDLSASSEATIEGGVEGDPPALIHAFHAYRVGPLALRLARRLEVPLVVTLTGTDANHDLFDPARAASVVLTCSFSEGGMPNSVLEALARGRAVLASDIPGNRTLVEDGVTGLLFADSGALAAQAARLARDPVLRGRLGAAGRALVESKYPPARELDGYAAVYRRLAPVASA